MYEIELYENYIKTILNFAVMTDLRDKLIKVDGSSFHQLYEVGI